MWNMWTIIKLIFYHNLKFYINVKYNKINKIKKLIKFFTIHQLKNTAY